MRVRPIVLPPGALADGAGPVELPGDVARHVRDVLRLRPGAPIRATDGAGVIADGTVALVERRCVVVDLQAPRSAPPTRPQVRLLQAVGKGDKLETVVRQTTELGVSVIQPVWTERGSARQSRPERLLGIVDDAMRVSGRAWRPEIRGAVSLAEALQAPRAEVGFVLALGASGSLAEKLTALASPPTAVDLLIGPEGGLSTNEVDASVSAGFERAHMGPHTLRTETAGPAAVVGAVLDEAPIVGKTGIGHTRWATHGAPTENNAHPHATERVSLVHNGIIENFAEIKARLSAEGAAFDTETDSEVIGKLITSHLENGQNDPLAAVQATLSELRGSFALAIIFDGENDLMIAARSGSPLAVGYGDGETFVGSDAYALAPFTDRVTFLEDGDVARVTRDTIEIFDDSGAPTTRPANMLSVGNLMVDKDGHRHFMAKEIHEQPDVIARTLLQYIDPETRTVDIRTDAIDFSKIDQLIISACGTAFFAGQISKYWFERYAGLRVEIDVASELRYRDIPYPAHGAALFISQSGETADTLAALRNARENGQTTAAVVNVPQSSIAREAACIFPTAAGPEIGVASTKAFTCQLATLACIAIAAGRARNVISAAEENELCEALLSSPRLVGDALASSSDIELIAKDLSKARDVLYIGRGVSFPLAFEGALKLKEISYIHAEAYAAGELKHGPIALIDEHTPVIVIAPDDRHFEKTVSNMHEVVARGGLVTLITDVSRAASLAGDVNRVIPAPASHDMITPLTYAPLIQLLAYFTAVQKGTDVDQPRNLAKSVTVE